MRVFIFIVFLFCNCKCELLFAQSTDLFFNQLTVNDGLSVSNGSFIFKDSKGYIWISTFDGLNRFDGIECTKFKNNYQDSNAIKGTLFLGIVEDKNSNLWIGSNDGINCYNRKNNLFKNYKYNNNTINSNTYSPFYIDSNNEIWIQSGQKILLFNLATNEFKEVYDFNQSGNLIIGVENSDNYQTINSLVVAIRGTSKILKLVILKNRISITPLEILKEESKINIIYNKNSKLYIGSSTGLYKLENNISTKIEINDKEQNVLAITSDSKDGYWIGTQKEGLFHLENNAIVQYKNQIYNPNSIMGDQVQYIYEDYSGMLWVSVWGKGISYVNLKKNTFSHHLSKLEYPTILQDNFIRSIIEVKPNRYWCATLLNGIIILDENKKIIKHLHENLPPTIEYIFKDSKNRIWIATLAGLFYSDVDGSFIKKFKGFQNYPLLSQQFNFLHQLQDGRILVSTELGLFFIEANDKVNIVKGVSNSDVYSTLYQAKNATVFVSKIQKGFSTYLIEKDSFVLKGNFNDLFTAKCFTEIADTLIWVSTTKGLIKFNCQKNIISKSFSEFDVLKNQYLYSALPYKEFLWLSSNNGIMKYNTLTNEIKTFSVQEGIQSKEFNTYSYCVTSNGEFLVGGINGINSFVPSLIKNDTTVGTLELENFYINDELSKKFININELNKITLTYNDNTISFVFSVLNFNNPKNCSILYKLEGFDKEWVLSLNKGLIRYPNLPSGDYKLKAIPINADGYKGNITYEWIIKVKTPWNKSWWFILLVIGAMALIVWYFVRSYYKRKIAKKQSELDKQKAIELERNRIAEDMHDDLGSGLTKITYLSQLAKSHIDKNDDLEKINKTSTELVENMSEIIWAMKEDNNTLNDLILYIKKYALDYCEQNQLNCQINSPDSFQDRIVKGENRRHIFLAIKEILHNIVKHANAKNVFITVKYSNKWEIEIKDDGIGISEDKLNNTLKRNGLSNIKKRIESVRGNVIFENQNGTIVKLIIPI